LDDKFKFESVDMTISLAQAQMFFLVLTRVMAMVIAVPVLGGQTIPLQVRVALGIILSAIIIPWQPLSADAPTIGLFGFAAAIFQELIIGTLSSFAVILTFGTVQMAGEFMGLGSGFASSRVLNPAIGETGTALDQLFVMAAMLLFLVLNGHHTFLIALQKTFEIIPVNSPLPVFDVQKLMRMTADLIAAGAQMALPVMGAMLLADIALGLLSRVSPQIQVFFLGMPLKVALGMFAMSLIFAYALPKIGDLYNQIGNRMILLISK
jgi:flagellar biosynthetic protein FliR